MATSTALAYVSGVALVVAALTLLVAVIGVRIPLSPEGFEGIFMLGIYGAARIGIAVFPADHKDLPLTERGRTHSQLANLTVVAITITVALLTPELVAHAMQSGKG